jgi:hypothetical protein
MKRTLSTCFFVLLAYVLGAQKIYFIYLQTETGEPFFVRMNDKLYSSESSGYLILPRLKDSTYKFKLGFPSKDVDLDFTASINKKDHGYLIKNLGEKGWGLFDLQSLDLQMSASNVKKETGLNNPNTNTQVNAFTALLAKATDDPSLRQNAVFAKETEKKPTVIQTIEKDEKKPAVTDAVVKEEKKPDQPAPAAAKPEEKKADLANTNAQKEDSQKNATSQNDVYKRSEVVKLSEGSSVDGFESVYVDQNSDGTSDTIRVFIPTEKTAVAIKEEPKIDSAKEAKNLNADSAQVLNKAKEEPKKEETKKWYQISIGKNKTARDGKEESKNDSSAEAKNLNTSTDTLQAVKKAREEPKKEETKKWYQISIGKNKTEKEGKEEPKNDATSEPKNLNTFPDSSQTVNKSKEEPKKEEKKWWQIAIGKNKTDTAAIKKCQTVANNDDFLKLRRKMAARTNDDGMLDEAKKYFKSKCFSTEQIKNLSTMFLSNAGKYNFFYVAYNYTTDIENFPSLQSELKDEDYIDRFKEMLHN